MITFRGMPCGGRSIFRRKRRTRGGYLYIAVLFTTLIVGAIAVAGLRLQTDQTNAQKSGQQYQAARQLADAAIELAIARINSNSSWRSTYTHGTAITPVTFGSGTISFSIHDDADSNLSNDANQSVRVRGIGTVGTARYVRSVQLEPSGNALGCMNYTVCSSNLFSPSTSVEWTTDGVFGFSGGFNTFLNFSTVSGDVHYRTFQWSYRTYGRFTALSTNIVMPGTNWADYYLREGTSINITSLPESSGIRYLQNDALGPNRNPWGSTNRLGIYIIDCANATLRIRNCRIRGTLLIRNPGSSSWVLDSVDWTPATEGMPALLAQGGFGVRTVEGQLSEAALGVNFNPTGMTDADSDTADVYPSRIQGLSYIQGTALVGQAYQRMVYHGCLACSGLSVAGDVAAYQIPGITSKPPPGFRDSATMRVIAGTWKREN